MWERHGEQIVATTTEAGQGVTGHNVRYVLVWSIVAVIVAFVIVYFLYFRGPVTLLPHEPSKSQETAMPLVSAAQKSLPNGLLGLRRTISRFAFDHRARSRIPLASWPEALSGTGLGVLDAEHSSGHFTDFKYHRVFPDGENAALEFSARIADIELKAVHLIRFNAAGEFVEIEIWCARWRAPKRSATRWVRQSGRK